MTDLDIPAGVLVPVRLRPLPATALRYSGAAREAEMVARLLGIPPVTPREDGTIPLACPLSGREAPVAPDMVVVRFGGDRFRFVVGDRHPFGWMYEENTEHGT